MIEIRTLCTHPALATLVTLATVAALLLCACSDAFASPLGNFQPELERKLRRAAQAQGQKRPQLMRVAAATEEQPKSTRHQKELNETKQKLETLQQEFEELAKKHEEVEAEFAQVKKQIQTLTWANEVLVKELDAAYATRGSGKPGSLPKGTRGIYMLRKGESLSRVAKAFYGDSKRWRDLVEANKDKIPDPDMVKAGTVILIPE